MSSQTKETATAEKPQQKKNTPLRQSFEDKPDKLQKKKQTRGPQRLPDRDVEEEEEEEEEESDSEPEMHMPARYGKHRMVPVHQSRIADRPVNNKASTMNIKIELDLEVEVEIYARVKGDVMIGLM